MLTAEHIEILSKPLPPEDHYVLPKGKTKDGKKQQYLPYIDQTGIIPLLNRIDPNWTWEVFNIVEKERFVYATGRLTLLGVSRDGVGENSPNGSSQPVDGDTVKGAVTDAFKRAALAFGVGLYLRNVPQFWINVTDKQYIDKQTALDEFMKWYHAQFGGNGRSYSAPVETTEANKPQVATKQQPTAKNQPSSKPHSDHVLADEANRKKVIAILKKANYPQRAFLDIAVEGKTCAGWADLPNSLDWIINRATELANAKVTQEADFDELPDNSPKEDDAIATLKALFPTTNIQQVFGAEIAITPINLALVYDTAADNTVDVVCREIGYSRGTKAEDAYLILNTPIAQIRVYNPYKTLPTLLEESWLESQTYKQWRSLGDKTRDIAPVLVSWDWADVEGVDYPVAVATAIKPL